MNTRRLTVLALVLLAGCVEGTPFELVEETPVAVLHRLVSDHPYSDTLELRADSTYRAKRGGTDLWVIGRYWFWTNALDFNFLCARPNGQTPNVTELECSVFENAPGVLTDPFSVFLHDGAVRYWVRVR